MGSNSPAYYTPDGNHNLPPYLAASQGMCMKRVLRASNTMKHVCVAGQKNADARCEAQLDVEPSSKPSNAADTLF